MSVQQEKTVFRELLASSEEWLMGSILAYAERFDYTRYTSTLKEAWRASIEGLSASLDGMLALYDQVPELHPDEDYSQDPAARFGMVEAQRHRERGVNLAMFLGLMKYYRQSYKDLLAAHRDRFRHFDYFLGFIERFFDRTEIAYCSEWAGLGSEKQIQALSATTLRMTNEKNKYLTLFDSFGSPAVLLDREGFVENMNGVAARIFKGFQVSGAYYYDENRPRERFAWIDAELQALIASDHKETAFEKAFRGAGEDYVFDVKIKELPDVSKKFVGYSVLLNDITELRRAQEQLILSEKMAALGGMVAGVAHEINTPVGIGVSAVTHLQDRTRQLSAQYHGDDLSEEAFEQYLAETEELTQLTYTNLRRAAELVRHFKQVAVDQAVDDVREFPLRDYLDGVLLSLKNQLKRTRIQVLLECPEELAIRNYPGAFSQIVTNLVQNSLVHGYEPNQAGRIAITVTRADGELELRYRDDGKGVEPVIRRKLFDPFFTTNRGGGSSGLGLHIVYKIVTDKLGGRIDLRSEPGQGVDFTIRVPSDCQPAVAAAD